MQDGFARERWCRARGRQVSRSAALHSSVRQSGTHTNRRCICWLWGTRRNHYYSRVIYTSKSQIARVFTEAWVAENGYCLACDSERLLATARNTQARDFECAACGHPYELKSSTRALGSKVLCGAYAAMMRRVDTGTVPTFLLMRYAAGPVVTDLSAIHRVFITPELIEKRNPLSPTADKAGWVGCKLLLRGVPPEGRIPLLLAGIFGDRDASREAFRATAKLAKANVRSRSWSRVILNCLHRLPSNPFSLDQVYSFEAELAIQFPGNRHIRPKIRQQLQVLRDAGLLRFEERGRYSLVYGDLPLPK